MSKGKIVFFQHVSGIGGSSWCLLEIIQELDRQRYEPLVVLRSVGPLVDELRRLDVKVFYQSQMGIIHQEYASKFPYFHLQFLRDIFRLKKAVEETRKLCGELKPDLVYLNSAFLFSLARGVKMAGESKVLLHIREHWSGHAKSLKNIYKNGVCRKNIDSFVSISETGAQCFGFPERTDIVRDWVGFSSRANDGVVDASGQYGVDLSEPYFLVPGGDSPVKGTIDAIKAFRDVKGYDLRIIILGSRPRNISKGKEFILRGLSWTGFVPAWYTIQKLAKKDERVVRLSHVQAIKPFLENCIAVIGSFRMTHCAKAALEAGMFDRPSILCEGGEAHEYVVPGKTGLIVPRRNPKALTVAMRTLLDDPNATDAMGRAARRHVEQHFLKDQSMTALRRIFDQNIAG